MKEKLQEEFKVYEDLINTILIDGLFIEVHYYPRKEYISRLDSIWNIFWRGIKSNVGKGE